MEGRAAGAGILGAAAALAVGELAGGLVPSIPSPLDAVGQQVVDGLPGPAVTGAIATFGAANRPLLTTATVLVVLGLGAVAGRLARERSSGPVLVFGAAGLLGAAASVAQPGANVVAVAVALGVAVGVGLAVLRRGVRTLATTSPADADAQPTAPPMATADPRDPRVARRSFLRLTLGVTVGAVLLGVAGRRWLGGGLDPASIPLPAAHRRLPAPGADLATTVPGLTPAFTPVDRFFRIDTALGVPRVDPDTWRLRIHGRVDREVELTYDELLALPLHEVDATIACVSNEVGGGLVGTARWLGVPLADVLALAGVRADAEQVLSRSVDGWTAGFPVAAVADGRQALVAVGMQGQALPTRHGFPARLVVPGLYGYVSATKWLTELELTAWDGVDGYWVPRGWAKRAPIKTASRIDVPRAGTRVTAGRTTVAGVAWAPTRGIGRVEIAVDDGPWRTAELVPVATDDVWVQWRVVLELPSGSRRLTVRATDGTGALQPAGPRPPAPDGAEGWHTVPVEVT
jgi:DMSO/TMAO reductase YedYZ molybdopterin-dependent catalytic subunit